MSRLKGDLKKILGSLPLTAELDFKLRRKGERKRGFRLERLEKSLEAWCEQTGKSEFMHQAGKKVFIFSTLPYWMEHAALLGLALAGVGHTVNYGYLPFRNWQKSENDFDLRQSNLYTKELIGKAEAYLNPISFLDVNQRKKLPPELQHEIEQISVRDVQYTEQLEEVSLDSELYKLRLARNFPLAEKALFWLGVNKPDVIIVPNGLILEFGVFYQVGKHLGIPVVSYEFGEQRDRLWLSNEREVMIQDTGKMWAGRKEKAFDEEALQNIKALFASRKGADLWNNFYRKWQDLPIEGEDKVKEKLGLDNRPIVMLAANVIGDSLTLGRQVFSGSMTAWLGKVLNYFAETDEVQFLLRAHPGERNLEGPGVIDVANEILPDTPEHFRLLGPDAPVNTYDLIKIADLGMTYTTTVGMEMAMSGLPVIVVGETHYRGKGFTMDPESWEDFEMMLAETLKAPEKLKPTEEKIQEAWHYAYRFFFDYPHQFPWHLIHLDEDIENWPLNKVLNADGLAIFQKTFDYLVGEPVDWHAMA
ncbi:MAG: hypothetical protein N2D54_09100 [Chloroflexota bacterium]